MGIVKEAWKLVSVQTKVTELEWETGCGNKVRYYGLGAKV